MFRQALFIISSVILFSAVGCGGEDDGENGGDGDGDGTNDLNLGDGDSSGGDGESGNGGIDGCNPEFSAAGCSGRTYEGENVPLDIYVMFDQSCSMSCPVSGSGCCIDDGNPESEWRITPVREAMRLFLQDPQSAGIGVGLGFFGDHNVNNNTDPDVCNVEAHSDAAVPIEVLPTAANNIIDTLEAEPPQGGTPTHLAIAGACQYSTDWKEANPAHKVVILLVTDGIPEHSCQADIEQAIDAANDCYDGGSGREIYVLGVEANNNNMGDSLGQLNDIAEAGGTEQAYLTDADDVAGSVLSALNAIRADAVIPCTLNIPEPEDGTIDYNQVNVGICDAVGDTVSTYKVEDPADCDNGGWYYDGPAGNQVVQLCDPTCETVTAAGSSLTLSVGCETVTDPIR